MTFVRASVVLAVSLLYLAYVFQLSEPGFWNAGVSYWLDPYFINVLLEHWYDSLRRVADPSSPPMYFPVSKTLGYSHGLVLYVPFYVPLRLFLHPFQAHNWTVFIVLEVGILCLYALLRKLGLSFTGSLALSALFFSSQNVINEQTSAWSQRASVFLIPPILLLLLTSARMQAGRPRLILASVAGCLSTLMYVQDFYTAHFALLFAVGFAAAAVFVEGSGSDAVKRMATWWQAQTRASQVALVTAAVAAAWTCYVLLFGGVQVTVWDVRLRSRDWRRPAVIAVVALVAFLGLGRTTRAATRFAKSHAWSVAVTLGAATGTLVFLWIYLGAYREHRAFPEDHLVNQLLRRDPFHWSSPLDVIRDLKGYHTVRSVTLAVVLGVLAWIPWFTVDRKARIYGLWFLAISFAVLLIPLRFQEFSVWRVFFEWLPGFDVIRDPKRIIYLYELAVVLVTAVFLTRLPARSVLRVVTTLLVLVLLVTARNPYVFRYDRPNAVYDRWVAAPIDIDPWCRSFYIKGASDEYMSRADDRWSMYGVDSLFVSLNHGIPTLNGYSAWAPDSWNLQSPQEAGYDDAVMRWIDRHKLTRVCEFDIDARTMRRPAPGR